MKIQNIASNKRIRSEWTTDHQVSSLILVRTQWYYWSTFCLMCCCYVLTHMSCATILRPFLQQVYSYLYFFSCVRAATSYMPRIKGPLHCVQVQPPNSVPTTTTVGHGIIAPAQIVSQPPTARFFSGHWPTIICVYERLFYVYSCQLER